MKNLPSSLILAMPYKLQHFLTYLHFKFVLFSNQKINNHINFIKLSHRHLKLYLMPFKIMDDCLLLY